MRDATPSLHVCTVCRAAFRATRRGRLPTTQRWPRRGIGSKCRAARPLRRGGPHGRGGAGGPDRPV